MANYNHTFNFTFNDSTTADPELSLNFDLPGYFVAALTLLFVTVAWIMNMIVLWALGKSDEAKLKVGFLLKNAIVGDMMLAFSLGLRIIFELAGWDESNTSLANLCANIIRDVFSYFATFYQIFANMAVALDRFYSILKPLDYHTMKYSRTMKIVAFLLMFSVTFAFSIPMVLVKLEPGDSILVACYKSFERAGYTEEVLPFVIVCSVFFTMSIYISIFLMVLFHRRKSQKTLGEQNETKDARKRQTSLAMTFFLIHITYVLMYIPGALYFSVIAENVLSLPYLNYYLSQLTIMIYLVNTIVDPAIYMFRIRSVREQVSALWCMKYKRKDTASAERKDVGVVKPQEPSLSTSDTGFTSVQSIASG